MVNWEKRSRWEGCVISRLPRYRTADESLLVNGSTQKFIAQRYHTTEANLHHWLKQHGLKGR